MASKGNKNRPVEAKGYMPTVANNPSMPRQEYAYADSALIEIVPHSLGGPKNLRNLQRLADFFGAWAASRFRTDCPSMFLAAASVTPDGLRRLLRQVTSAICHQAPPLHSRQRCHPHDLPPRKDRVYWHVCQTLNGFVLLDETFNNRNWGIQAAAPSISSKVNRDTVRLAAARSRKQGQTDALFDEINGGALDCDRRKRAMHEGLRMAVQSLEDFLENDLCDRPCPRNNPIHSGFIRAVRRVVAASRRLKNSGSVHGFIRDADAMRAVSEGWIETCLPWQKRGRIANQAKARSLRRHVAYVCQYGHLLAGNEVLDDLVNAVVALRLLCEALVTRLKKLPGRKQMAPKRPLPPWLFKRYDAEVLKSGLVYGWRQALKDTAKPVGAFSRTLAKRRISGTWTRGEYVDLAYVEKGGGVQRIGDGKRLSAKSKRRLLDAFVEDMLVPMQAVGLAAEVPWDYLWANARDPKVPVKGHEGKKWVANPFGLLLVSDDVV